MEVADTMEDAPEMEANQEKQEEGAAAEQGEAPEVDPLQAMAAERERLAEQYATLHDQLLRKQADFQNFRKRVEREQQEFRNQITMEVIREILPVLDALERALATTDASEGEFRSGVQLIARQLWDTLTRFGLEPMETRGQKFDPHLHQAVEMVETSQHADQTILEEWQRGYLFRKRLLRPAMVKVAVRRESQ